MQPQSQARGNHFEEQFEESEAYLEEAYLQPSTVARGGQPIAVGEGAVGSYNINDERPIQLVKIRPNGKVELDEGALELISMYNKPIGFVCLAGKYRTGKSFLLNKLLGLRGAGFKVDASTTACTEGIWMWSKPLYNEKEDCYLFFLDTEGSDSTNRNSDHDARVFTIAVLISSYFIYNSVGAIDELSIGQLNLVTSLSKNIAVGQGASEDALFHYMPKFMWLLRDFVLEIKDERGRRLTPTEYLQNCLLEQNTQVRTSESARNIRRALINYFRERDCMMLVRPALEENDLKMLAQLPDHRLRRQFLDGVAQLKAKIMNNAAPKVINGQPINSLIFAELLSTYVEAINNNAIPNITSAWEQVTEQAGAEAYNAGIDTYNELYSVHFAVDEPKGEQIYGILKEMHEKALQAFDAQLESPNDRYRNKLKNFLFEKERAILQINNDFNNVRNVELLREYSGGLTRNVQTGKYSAQNSKLLAQDMNDMINRYNANAKGSRKCEILSEFLVSFNPMLINSYTITTSKQVALAGQMQAGQRQADVQNEATVRALQDRIDSMKREQSAKVSNLQMKSAEEKKRLQGEMTTLRRQLEEARKKKDEDKKKCCAIF